jgi:integrase/recombinase XerD
MYTLKKAENVSDGTINNKQLAVKLLTVYIGKHGLDITPYTLTAEDCRAFIHYLRYEHIKHENNPCKKEQYKTAGLADQTVNTHLRHLKAYYNFLVMEDYLQANPFKNVKQLKEPMDAVDSLNEDEVKALLSVPDKRTFAGFRDYVLTVLLIDTGLRITEALTLTKDKIDFRSQTIIVTADIAKTGKPRYVPFGTKTNKLLRELISEVSELNTDCIFVTVYGNALCKDVFRNRLKSYAKRTSIKKNVTVHQLRHTFCRLYLANGGDIFTLQRMTGHASIVTLRRYLQFDTQDIINKHAKHSPFNNIRI